MEKRTLKIPEKVIELADIGGNQLIVLVPSNILLEQDKNAHLMKPEMFRQLAENIKKKGQIESLPFCALTDKGIEIVSGHHRTRAAVQAGIKDIPIILDVSGLSSSQIAAKQIAHNAINGFDDKSLLKEIVKLISEVDDMIESYIGNDVLGEPDEDLEKLISPKLNFDWKEVQMIFLPHQVKDLEVLVKNTQGNNDYSGAVNIEQYETLLATIAKYQKFSNITNIGAAVHRMIETTNEVMDNAEYKEGEEWVSLSRLLGNVAVPKELAEVISEAIDTMVKDETINARRKWDGLGVMAKSYLNNK